MEGIKLNGSIMSSLKWNLRGLRLLKKYFQDHNDEIGAKVTQQEIDRIEGIISSIETDIQNVLKE